MRTVFQALLTTLIIIGFTIIGDVQATNLKIDTTNWEGAGWIANTPDGWWFPDTSIIDTANFYRNDFSWGQIRTKNFISKGQKISLDIQTILNSGGTNGDGAFVGFTDGWAFYEGRFVGLMFESGNIYLFDYQSGDPGGSTPIVGSYTTEQWHNFTFQVTTDNVLIITGSGINESHSIENIWSECKFNITNYDSELDSGIRVTNITLNDPSSLTIPSIAAASCDDECMVQPINVNLSQAIKGATVPLAIPNGIEICSLSTQGLLTEEWTFQNDVKVDSGFIATGLWNITGDSIPVGEHTLFNIWYRDITGDIDPWFIHWDTAYSNDVLHRLTFANVNNLSIYPNFDYSRDSTEYDFRIQGDANNDNIKGISDLTYFVDYMFGGGPAPYHPEVFDINGECEVNISDLTYFVDYLFGGGSEPICGCASTPTSKIVDKNYSVNTFYKDNTTIIQLNALSDILGLQLELAGTSISEPVILSNDNLELLHNYDNNILKLGLLDLNGGEVIKSGSNSLIKLEGEFEIISATISDMNHNSITPTINSAVKETSLPIVFSLNQNYPNPFNPVTEISYSLPKAGHVKLEVYNTLGQRVASLIDEQKEAGVYTISWDASNNASGIYLYKIQAGEFVETKKMMLLK